MAASQLNRTYFRGFDDMQGWNNTTFISLWNEFYREDWALKYVEFTMATLLGVISLISNILMLVLFIMRRHSIQSGQNLYIIAVIATSIVYILPFSFMIGATRLTYGWTYGDFGCKIFVFIYINTACVKAWLMALTSVYRYLNIVKKKTVTIRTTLIMIATALVVPSACSLIVSCMTVFAKDIEFGEDSFTICTVHFPYDASVRFYFVAYALFLIVFYFVPIIVTATCSALIICQMNKSEKLFKNRNSTYSTSAAVSPKESKQSHRKRLVTRALLTVLVIFVLMWTPFYVVLGYMSYDDYTKDYNLSSKVLFGTVCCQIVNTIIEPFLYTLTSREVRKTIKSILLCRNFRRSQITVSTDHSATKT